MTLREWWLTRQQITVNPQYQRNPDGSSTLTLALNGTSSPDTAVEIQTPQLGNVEVLLNGVPSSNYRTTSSGIKIQTGMSTNVTLNTVPEEVPLAASSKQAKQIFRGHIN
jgi:hypothetical protein